MCASMYARLNVECTHTRETCGSRFLNNAHVLYRKCLFIVHNKYSARTYRSEWKLHALPPPILSCALVRVNVHVHIVWGTVDGVKVTNDRRALMFSTATELSVGVYTVIFHFGFVE